MLRDCLPHLTWDNLKNEHLEQYLTIPFNSHATQSVDHLQQGPSELLEMYLHRASEPLSKIHHMVDLSQILGEGLNYYTMVSGQNVNKVKDNIVGHQSTYCRTVEDCFSNICVVGVGYERAKGYS